MSDVGFFYGKMHQSNIWPSSQDLTVELIAYAVGAHHGLFDCIKDKDESAFAYRLEKENIDSEEAIENFYNECASEDEIEKLLLEATDEIKSSAMIVIAWSFIKHCL